MSTNCPHGYFKEVASRSCPTCRNDALINSAEIIRVLLTLARKYASECAECAGEGQIFEDIDPAGNRMYLDCHECADIRAVIHEAERKA